MVIEPNRADMDQHLRLLIEPWRGRLSAQIEFRALIKGQRALCWFSGVEGDLLEDSIDKIVRLNEAETARNIYVTVNPVSLKATQSARDTDILAAYFSFADADNGDAAARLRDALPRPSFFVHTGSVPENRVHAYWCFDGTEDLEAWTALQKRIQATYGTDSVCNPSRVLRLAGTVSWPDQGKRKRGYQPEVSRLVEGCK